MHEWESLSHVRWDCKYHIVIMPKYHQKVLYGVPGTVSTFMASPHKLYILSPELPELRCENQWLSSFSSKNKCCIIFHIQI